MTIAGKERILENHYLFTSWCKKLLYFIVMYNINTLLQNEADHLLETNNFQYYELWKYIWIFTRLELFRGIIVIVGILRVFPINLLENNK